MLKINISPTCQQCAVVIEAVASHSDIELEGTRSAFQLSSALVLYNSRRQLYFVFFPLSQTVLIHLGDGEEREESEEERTARMV